MNARRAMLHLTLVAIAVGACRAGGPPATVRPLSPQEMAATLQSSAATAASDARTQVVEMLATATALAGELRPTGQALLTQAAGLAATGRVVLATAAPRLTLGPVLATPTPTPEG